MSSLISSCSILSCSILSCLIFKLLNFEFLDFELLNFELLNFELLDLELLDFFLSYIVQGFIKLVVPKKGPCSLQNNIKQQGLQSDAFQPLRSNP